MRLFRCYICTGEILSKTFAWECFARMLGIMRSKDGDRRRLTIPVLEVLCLKREGKSITPYELFTLFSWSLA